MRVLTAEQMRAVDTRAIEELGIPSLVLMENAAIGVADALAERFPAVETVTLACGPGNNGGDGLAVARHLDARGYRVRTFLVTGSRSLSGDAAEQLRILERSGRQVWRLDADDDAGPLIAAVAGSDLWVDALFGTGLSRPLEGGWARLVADLGSLGVPMLAVDLPSGLSGSSPEKLGSHARAALTVTFAAPKVAHVLPPACEAMGEVVVA
ncbi:MAG: NAD(P)H-hydrate epimerase, partial [Holophagales bacterium]|nr:NAD(P)H-hydrate epimerase [Holophagales bacterium]